MRGACLSDIIVSEGSVLNPVPDQPWINRMSATQDELQRIRDSIDNIDAALIHILAERFKFTQQVGALKARTGMPQADPAREAQQIARLRALAEQAKLDPEFAEKLLNFIVKEVIRHHIAQSKVQ